MHKVYAPYIRALLAGAGFFGGEARSVRARDVAGECNKEDINDDDDDIHG